MHGGLDDDARRAFRDEPSCMILVNGAHVGNAARRHDHVVLFPGTL